MLQGCFIQTKTAQQQKQHWVSILKIDDKLSDKRLIIVFFQKWNGKKMNFKRCFTEWRQYCQLWQIFIMFKHKKIPLIISTRTNTQNRLVCHELKLRSNVRSWFRWIHFSQKMTHCFFSIFHLYWKRSEDIHPQCKMRAQGHSVICICDVACDGFVHLSFSGMCAQHVIHPSNVE